jgi:isopropylmalate/homocitrate/citramalate synthase
VTNAATAWLYGCSAVNTAALGIGERTGNCPLEAMMIEYASLKGDMNGMDLSAITKIAEYFEKEMGMDIPPRTPFVGSMFNTTKAGIHADGLLKDEEIYNIFDTERILNRPPKALIDSHSGLAGIAHWVNSYYGLSGEHGFDKRADLVVKMKGTVDQLYVEGRNSVMTDAELDEIKQECEKMV